MYRAGIPIVKRENLGARGGDSKNGKKKVRKAPQESSKDWPSEVMGLDRKRGNRGMG